MTRYDACSGNDSDYPKSVPSTPSWMGEVAAFAQVLTHTEILTKIQEQVRFARAHFGQEFAQILAQWVWNLRLELGHQLVPAELRTTEFASVHESEAFSTDKPLPVEAPAPGVTYGPPQWARSSFTHGFPGSALMSK